VFKPAGIPARELAPYVLRLDEFEAMRICDLEGKSQIEAAELMDISRGTVQRLLERGRRTLVACLLANQALVLESALNRSANRSDTSQMKEE